MTDPTDDTQPHPSADSGAAANGAPADGAPALDGAADGPPVADPTAPADGAPAPGPSPASGSGPSLRADPDRPADSGWREPPWFPPRDGDRGRDRGRKPSAFALVIGLALIAIGAYYFLDRTLGVALPSIQWSSVWPIVLIVIGGLILIRSFQRRS